MTSAAYVMHKETLVKLGSKPLCSYSVEKQLSVWTAVKGSREQRRHSGGERVPSGHTALNTSLRRS